MSTFEIDAVCESARLRAAMDCADIDRVLDWYDDVVSVKPKSERRAQTRGMVIEAMLANRHETSSGSEIVGAALLWLAATGPIASQIMPFVRAGNMTLRYDITHLVGRKFNLRVSVDQETAKSAAM